jgi:hypothetical protein
LFSVLIQSTGLPHQVGRVSIAGGNGNNAVLVAILLRTEDLAVEIAYFRRELTIDIEFVERNGGEVLSSFRSIMLDRKSASTSKSLLAMSIE